MTAVMAPLSAAMADEATEVRRLVMPAKPAVQLAVAPTPPPWMEAGREQAFATAQPVMVEAAFELERLPTPDDGPAEPGPVVDEVSTPTPAVAEPVTPPPASPASPLDRPLVLVTLDARPDAELAEGVAGLPEQFAIVDESLNRFGAWHAPLYDAAFTCPRFCPTAFHWAAPAVYTRPLYFEQPNVERYGHHVAVCPGECVTQSALSAAHFFVSVPFLPYMAGAEPPDECNYVLGAYRPGSCNPRQSVTPRWSWRGLAYQGAAVTGLVYLIP